MDVADPQEAQECDDPTVTPEHRGVGVFVLYNYARLSTLLENYHKAVAEGKYPKFHVGRWFPPGTPVSSSKLTFHHNNHHASI